MLARVGPSGDIKWGATCCEKPNVLHCPAAGGLASLVPSAALYANRLHSGGYAPGGAFLGTPGAAAPGGLEGARWVSERGLPLWLVRTHEEKARREAAILATRAQQEAERVCCPFLLLVRGPPLVLNCTPRPAQGVMLFSGVW